MSRFTSKLLSDARAMQKAAKEHRWNSLEDSFQALKRTTQDPNVVAVVAALIEIIKAQDEELSRKRD